MQHDRTPLHDRGDQDPLTRATHALDYAKGLIRAAEAERDEKTLAALQVAVESIQTSNVALLLALLRNEWTPAKLFAPWASVRRVRDWGAAGHITVTIKHGRSCVKPADFFRYFASLTQ